MLDDIASRPIGIRLAPSSALQPGESARVDVDGKVIALFNVDGHFYAIDDACLHMAGPLSEGMVLEGTVTCPWHGWSYELETGKRVGQTGSPLRKYRVDVVEHWITFYED